MPTFQDVQPIVANHSILTNSVVVIILVKLAHSIPMHSIEETKPEKNEEYLVLRIDWI